MGIKVSGVDFRLINMTNEGLLAQLRESTTSIINV